MLPRSQFSQRAVLRLIANGQATSLQQLSRSLRLPPNTIHGVINRLLDQGTVCLERTERYGRGRPIRHYRVQRRKPVLVIQWLGSVWQAAVFVDRTVIGELQNRSLPPLQSAKEAVAALRTVRDLTLKAANLGRGKIAGIVLAINAVADGGGRVSSSSVLPWMRGVSGEQLGRALACRVQLANAVDTVIPELRARAAHGVRSLAVLNVGDGVSAHGQSVDRVWGAPCAFPGEVGHVVVDPCGPICGCGNRGCLEAFLSGPALLKRLARDVKRGTKTQLAAALHQSPSELFDRLEALDRLGTDRYARRLTDEFLDRAAWAVSLVLNMISPEVIVLSGYALAGRDGWRRRIEEKARTLTLFGKTASVRIEFPLLGTADYLRELASSFDLHAWTHPEGDRP